MLGTEWVAPGEGATVKELLDWVPDFIVVPWDLFSLKPYLNQKTTLRLTGGQRHQYDLERINEAIRRMTVEAEICVTVAHAEHSYFIEHVHFGGQSDVRLGELVKWVGKCEEAWLEEMGETKISTNCFEAEEEIRRMEDKQEFR